MLVDSDKELSLNGKYVERGNNHEMISVLYCCHNYDFLMAKINDNNCWLVEQKDQDGGGRGGGLTSAME